MKAFQVSDIIINKSNIIKVKGRALCNIKKGDSLQTDNRLSSLRVLDIFFWGKSIIGIESPHSCELLIELEKEKIRVDDFLYKNYL